VESIICLFLVTNPLSTHCLTIFSKTCRNFSSPNLWTLKQQIVVSSGYRQTEKVFVGKVDEGILNDVPILISVEILEEA
jgi:hypothetical protein